MLESLLSIIYIISVCNTREPATNPLLLLFKMFLFCVLNRILFSIIFNSFIQLSLRVHVEVSIGFITGVGMKGATKGCCKVESFDKMYSFVLPLDCTAVSRYGQILK